jgi:hypothetical protein
MNIGSKINFEYEEVLDRKTPPDCVMPSRSRRMPEQPLRN